jgi:hypothetical protein
MKKFWTLPILAIYMYCLTILTQYGFLAYFNIPSSFIEVSIRDNAIYAYSLFEAIKSLIWIVQWWQWLIAALLFTAGSIFLHNFGKIILAGVTILMIIFLANAVRFGNALAQNQTNFLIMAPDCPPINGSRDYIVPSIYQGNAILVPVDKDMKIQGGFLLKAVSEMSCKLESKQVGKVKR